MEPPYLMHSADTKKLTLATKITLLRVFLIPVFVICLAYGRPDVGLFVFILAGVGDGVDGYIARTRGEMTHLGAMLDPIADKLLMFAAYALMGFFGHMPAWLAIAVISRDIMICLGCLILFMTAGSMTPMPTLLGKSTTVAQMITAGAALLAAHLNTSSAPLMSVIYLITGTLTIVSGAHYLFFVGARMLTQKNGGSPSEGTSPAARV